MIERNDKTTEGDATKVPSLIFWLYLCGLGHTPVRYGITEGLNNPPQATLSKEL